MKWLFPFALLATPALAETCPPAADHSVRLAEIVSDLQVSRGSREADLLSAELWELWLDAPDAKSQAMLDRGMELRSRYNLDAARDALDELVAYCPDYAEGYNQRAFANYLRQDFAAALVDLDRAIEMVPNHVAAIAGRGLTLMGMGRHDDAQQALKDAVALNPWLNERELIVDPVGTDI